MIFIATWTQGKIPSLHWKYFQYNRVAEKNFNALKQKETNFQSSFPVSLFVEITFEWNVFFNCTFAYLAKSETQTRIYFILSEPISVGFQFSQISSLLAMMVLLWSPASQVFIRFVALFTENAATETLFSHSWDCFNFFKNDKVAWVTLWFHTTTRRHPKYHNITYNFLPCSILNLSYCFHCLAAVIFS